MVVWKAIYEVYVSQWISLFVQQAYSGAYYALRKNPEIEPSFEAWNSNVYANT